MYREQEQSNLYEVYEDRDELEKQINEVIDAMKKVSRKLAKSEREYRIELTKTMVLAHNGMLEVDGVQVDPVAWTSCETFARGIGSVANLRFARDKYSYDYETLKNKMFQLKAKKRQVEGDLDSYRNGNV